MDLAESHGPNHHADCVCTQIIHADRPLVCKHCKRSLITSDDLASQVSLQAAEIERLKKCVRDKDEAIQSLNNKLVAEIERVAAVQLEKDLVEHELEELSCKLFEEANGMVAEEKREKWYLEKRLRQTQEQLVAEQDQLRELRQKITAAEPEEDMHPDNPHTRARLDLQELHGVKRASANNVLRRQMADLHHAQQRANSMPPLPSFPKPIRTATIDEIQLEAFREFVQMPRNVLPKKMNQFAYMKHCLAEDVELCLRFGPHSRLSVKKLMDNLSRQSCFIEPIPEEEQVRLAAATPPTVVTQRRLWNKSAPTGGYECATCGRRGDIEHPLIYRFRQSEDEPWLPIDQYCRDRLVAVCEFFVFIRNIRLKLYADRSIDDLYSENIRLRLQMFYSRMGALPVILDGIGVDPDAVGRASSPTDPLGAVQDDAYTSDCSVSTSGPYTPTVAFTLSKATDDPPSECWAPDSPSHL